MLNFDLYDIMGISTIVENVKEKLGIKKEYKADQITPVRYSFRPENLEQYVGQERAKELINLNVQKIKEIKPVHFIISGTRGHGKSTLAYIIAKMINAKVHTYIGGSFTMENLEKFLVENSDSQELHVLFIDEIHGLRKEIAEFLYPVLEDFRLPLGNLKLKPFVFIGATTEKNILLKKFNPLVDRCGCQVNLEHYNAEDIKVILKQYNDKLYQKNIEEEVYDKLARNTRFNPRTSLAMFDDLIICKNLDKVLNAHRIVRDSLTTDDLIILRHLAEIDKPVGVETLGIIIQQTKQDFQMLQETFLISEGYISRTSRGRIITEKGKIFLKNFDE